MTTVTLDWVQDGVTPHPTGGYLSVYTSRDYTEYVNDKGVRHRLDGPAYTHVGGRTEYWVEGQQHRLGGPAIVDGLEEAWCDHGVLHRLDGPAITSANGTREWYVNGVRHREDGPSIERGNGSSEWHLHGKRHRVDGPAVTNPDGAVSWCLYGQKVSQEEHAEIVALLRETGEAPDA